MIFENGSPRRSLTELVLFPFDDYSLPFQRGVGLKLVAHRTYCGGTRVVLGPGEEGAPDSRAVVYYGSVHRVGDELRMWYLGQGPDKEWFERLCFATSRDGYHWEKPQLGLVEYRGSRANNLVDLNQGSHHVQSCVVFHDPEEPDPARRFKMVFQSRKYSSVFAAAYSSDGLVWGESPKNPVGSRLEMAGGLRFNGLYYVSGQGGEHGPPARQMVTYVSHDFESWPESFCISFRRGDDGSRDLSPNAGKQVHLGAGLWNRGNVILGLYGKWDGHPSNDRRLVIMDLGLVVSQDALHYREPVADFPMVSAAEDGWKELPNQDALMNFPALIQGQGFENVGDETLFWYAPWPEQKSDGVRVARWKRDRLGYAQPLRCHLRRPDSGHCVSAPIHLEGKPARVFLNVDGIGEYGRITTEVFDEKFKRLAAYGRDDCVAADSPGLRQLVQWKERAVIEPVDGPIRLRFNFEGVRPEDIRLYAAYVVSGE